MSREMIVHKGTKVFFHSMVYRDMIKMQEEWCAVCNKKIYKGDTIRLIMNNQVLFPNVYVHDACIESKENCVNYLTEDYKRFKEFSDIYKVWISRTYDV